MNNKTLPRPKKSLFSFLRHFILLQPWKFIFIFFLSLTWSLESTVWPFILRKIIDIFTLYETDRSNALSALKWPLISAVCLWIYVEVAFRCRDFLRTIAVPHLESDIRMYMFDHIQHHSPRYFNEHFAGSLSNKISDMTTQATSILQNLMIFIPAIASTILTLIFFTAINPLFAYLMAIWIALHFFICYLFTSKCIKTSNLHGEARSHLAGKIVDSLTNNFSVNLFYRFQFEKKIINHYQDIEREKNTLTQYYASLMLALLSLLFLVGIITLNTLLIRFWMDNKISTGEVIQIFNTTFNVIMILWYSADLMPQFFKSIGIATQALSVMNDPQDVIDTQDTPSLIIDKGKIQFKNVSFQYNEKQLFNNKNITIKGGEKVGLVGYSGAGKSSFVSLILRLFNVQQGEILIDGQDISKITLESLRRQIALIPQDPILFHRTLEENIRYGNVNASKDDVILAAISAHCDEFIKKTPKGYDSLVGERGTMLSGGERQRIAIARAMLSKSPILILDEATSSLDSVTEKYIQDSLETLMQNRTTLVIAHRLSTLAKMDRILVFDQGKIIEEGTHSQLLEKQGYYAKMWQMQVRGLLPNAPMINH